MNRAFFKKKKTGIYVAVLLSHVTPRTVKMSCVQPSYKSLIKDRVKYCIGNFSDSHNFTSVQSSHPRHNVSAYSLQLNTIVALFWQEEIPIVAKHHPSQRINTVYRSCVSHKV